jgi:O-acetyl-ADP-ribose deacetylase (regulator of RNase III)
LQRPLRELVIAGLEEADKQQLSVITFPTIRTGIMSGAYEATVNDALNEMAIAIMEFIATNPQHVEEIIIVVYNDEPSERFLQNALRQ